MSTKPENMEVEYLGYLHCPRCVEEAEEEVAETCFSVVAATDQAGTRSANILIIRCTRHDIDFAAFDLRDPFPVPTCPHCEEDSPHTHH